MDRSQEMGNLIEFLRTLLATMEDVDTVAFIAGDLAAIFLQHQGRLSPSIVSQVLEVGKMLLQNASTHGNLGSSALLLLKNTMQWIEN